jgi:hypothetical protein
MFGIGLYESCVVLGHNYLVAPLRFPWGKQSLFVHICGIATVHQCGRSGPSVRMTVWQQFQDLRSMWHQHEEYSPGPSGAAADFYL